MHRITGPTEDMTAWYAWNDRMYRDTVLIFLENIRTVPILQVEIRHTYVEVFRDCLKFI